ncbi:insulinase family protein [Lactobacillus sp. PV037]|uniref:M16 family metallopeptidase n=1 Tax=Lactobacillus sp. PV037 TaxID=2594496 RepID=UPI00223FCE0D|nr:insulinase family protein [Lactobacillus sp. PV037]QNQ83308.1 insulinase family protein [Lactobacillus sp. PV037]
MTNIKIDHNIKFTTATIGCFLRVPLSKKNLALATLLATMQSNASILYPGIRNQTTALDELYDAQLDIFPEVFGNQIIMQYVINFVEPSQILDPDYNYQKIIELFFEIIDNPLFNETLMQLAKNQLKEEYESFYDIPANLGYKEFLETWYRNKPQYASQLFGSIEDLEDASIKDLQDFFEGLKKAPSICLGQAMDPDTITDYLQKHLTNEGFEKEFKVEDLTIAAIEEPIEKVAPHKSLQGQILVGYGYGQKLERRVRQFGGLFLSHYLAGDESSKLFTDVREKLGAAYGIEAVDYFNNSMFLISSSIDKNKYSEVEKIIIDSIKKIQNGVVDQEVFKKSKKALKRIYLEAPDRQGIEIVQMLTNSLRGRETTFKDRVKVVEEFTSEQMIEFAKTLFINERYYLV